MTPHVRPVVGLSVCHNFLKVREIVTDPFGALVFYLDMIISKDLFYFAPAKCRLCPGELDLHLQKSRLCLENSYNYQVD